MFSQGNMSLVVIFSASLATLRGLFHSQPCRISLLHYSQNSLESVEYYIKVCQF